MSSSSKITLKEEIKKYLFINFSRKNNIKRILIFLISCFIVFLPAFLMRDFALTLQENKQYGDGFITIFVTFNDGVGFGYGNYITAYILQSLISLIMLVIIIFVNKWYYILLLSLVFFGGLFNIIDRAIPDYFTSDIDHLYPEYNSVVDYFKFSFDWGIFNVADIFVCFGTIIAAIIAIIMIIIQTIKDSKIKENDSKTKK